MAFRTSILILAVPLMMQAPMKVAADIFNSNQPLQ